MAHRQSTLRLFDGSFYAIILMCLWYINLFKQTCFRIFLDKTLQNIPYTKHITHIHQTLLKLSLPNLPNPLNLFSSPFSPGLLKRWGLPSCGLLSPVEVHRLSLMLQSWHPLKNMLAKAIRIPHWIPHDHDHVNLKPSNTTG